MREFKYITIDGNTPYERGKQHGEAARELIGLGLDRYHRKFKAPWETVREKAERYVEFLTADYSDLLDEIRGIGDGAGVDFEDMMVLNTRYELSKFPFAKECTTFAVLPDASENRHVYLGMNWDNARWMQDSSLLFHVNEQNGIRYFCMTEAGQLIRHGFNNFGVGIVTNNLDSKADTDGVGVPTNFMRRRVITSRSMEEAVDHIVSAPRAVSCNLMIGSENGTVDLEVNPKYDIRIMPDNGILTHANHFRVHRELEKDFDQAFFRDVRLYSLLERRRGSINPEFIQDCLKDHYRENPESGEAVCNHDERWAVTIASQIYDLTAKEAFVCCGNPCEGTYRHYSL